MGIAHLVWSHFLYISFSRCGPWTHLKYELSQSLSHNTALGLGVASKDSTCDGFYITLSYHLSFFVEFQYVLLDR